MSLISICNNLNKDNINESNKLIELLLRSGAEPNIQDCYGNTALIYVAMQSTSWKMFEAIKLLLRFGADPDIENNEGKTALSVIPQFCNDDFEQLESMLANSKSKINNRSIHQVNNKLFSIYFAFYCVVLLLYIYYQR